MSDVARLANDNASPSNMAPASTTMRVPIDRSPRPSRKRHGTRYAGALPARRCGHGLQKDRQREHRSDGEVMSAPHPRLSSDKEGSYAMLHHRWLWLSSAKRPKAFA